MQIQQKGKERPETPATVTWFLTERILLHVTWLLHRYTVDMRSLNIPHGCMWPHEAAWPWPLFLLVALLSAC